MVQFYKSNGEWRWRIIAKNGNVLADGGEGYKNKKDAKNGLRAALDILLSHLLDNK